MAQPSASLHLRLFGPVAWIGANGETTVDGRPAELLAILALRQPEWVSVDSLIDRLWERPPESGANAVQRIVARARRQLDELGTDAKHIVESSHAGYRLAPHVNTDLQPRSDEIFEPPGALVAWWEPPLANIDLDRAGPVRAMLDLAAARHCRRWVDDVVEAGSPTAALTWLLAHRRIWQLDPDVVEHALRLAELSSDRSVRREVATRIIDVVDITDGVVLTRAEALIAEPATYADLGMLAPCCAAIDAGDVGAAYRALADVDVVDEVRERVEFWLEFAPLDDGFSHVLWREITGCCGAILPLAEQGAVSLDAFALEHTGRAVELADTAIAEAADIDQLVRALRVRFMVGLGYPVDGRQDEMVERLASLDHPDACVEAPRFAAMLAVKQRQPSSALEWLDRATDEAARRWPGSMFDHDVLVRQVMHEVWRAIATPDRNVVPLETNLDIAHLIRLVSLCLGSERLDDDEGKELEHLRSAAHGCTRAEAARAFDLLAARRRGDLDEATATADEMASVWLSWPPNRHRHVGLVALGLHAEAVGDAETSAATAEFLEPWRDEMLGIWPMDALLGAADDWIERFAAVGRHRELVH